MIYRLHPDAPDLITIRKMMEQGKIIAHKHCDGAWHYDFFMKASHLTGNEQMYWNQFQKRWDRWMNRKKKP